MSDIPPVNSSDGFTPYLIGFYVDTEHGWVGPYDKRAIESMIAAVRNKALHDAADEIERLRAQLAAAEASHKVAVAGRNHEQATNARMRASLERNARLRVALERAHEVWETEAAGMRDEIDQLRADAERYRWLRDKSGGWFAKDEGDWSLDAAIDVARIEK